MVATHPIRTSTSHGFHDFREAVARSFLPLEVTRRSNAPFWGRMRSLDFDDVHVHEISATAHAVERTESMTVGADAHLYKASLLLAGEGLLVQDGREALLRPGDLAIYDTDRPYSLVFDDDMRMLVLMFPRERVALPPASVAQLTAHRFSSDDRLGGMVIPFLQGLPHTLERIGTLTGPRLVNTSIDLLTTMFASELDLDAESVDSHHLLMERIRGYIDEHLSRPELAPAEIAAAHFISTRHLHGLFRQKGTTVSTWIRERRLEHCRRELMDPLHAAASVGAIAARWGFIEAAHFSRVFKAAYGLSPSALRRRSVGG